MALNQFGFPQATGFEGPALSQQSGVTVRATALPDVAETRLADLMAFRLLNIGQHRQALSDARGALQAFNARVAQAYGGKTLEALQADEKTASSARVLQMELFQINRDLAAATRADLLYAADAPLTRGSLAILSELATECARYVNRARELQEAPPVTLTKADTAEALQASISAADDKIEAVELAWPLQADAWMDILSQLDEAAKLPDVLIHNRETPLQAPREFSPLVVSSLVIPERSSLHPTAPGSSLRLNLPDGVGLVFAFLRPQIEEHLKQRLEAQYEGATARGVLMLSAKDRKASLRDAKAAKLNLERKLAELFWTGKAAATVLSSETSPAAVLGVL